MNGLLIAGGIYMSIVLMLVVAILLARKDK